MSTNRKSTTKVTKVDAKGKSVQNNDHQRASVTSITTIGSIQSGRTSLDEGRGEDPIAFLDKRGYQTVRLLGEGGFAKVHEAKEKANPKNRYAIKIFDLSNEANAYWIKLCLKNEMYISTYMKHPNIIMTAEVLKTHYHGFIVMQFAARGNIQSELFYRLRRPYTEEETKKHFQELTAGLKYMHEMNVAHRDLKLDNFLLDGNNIAMIGDFGFAALGLRQNATILTKLIRKTPCGTPGYMAPELFMKKGAAHSGTGYNAKAVDIYAMGISLFEMLNLTKPFSTTTDEATVQKIIRQDIRYVVEVPQVVRELIASMVQIDPAKRPDLDEVIKGTWLNPSVLTSIVNKLFS